VERIISGWNSSCVGFRKAWREVGEWERAVWREVPCGGSSLVVGHDFDTKQQDSSKSHSQKWEGNVGNAMLDPTFLNPRGRVS